MNKRRFHATRKAATNLVQALVYTLIGLAALAMGATAYFGLAFTPTEAILASIVFACAAVVLMERRLRVRAENRLERAIEDLARLLATDAQAGAVLGQRINALTDLNAGQRLEGMEADISVLGTVIRQVAEAVAEIEDRVPARVPASHHALAAAQDPDFEPEARISLDALRQALAENRLVFQVQPVVTLPQRRIHGYDIVPRLMLGNGELVDRADFMPRRGGEETVRRIEGLAMGEAMTIARRARSNGQPLTLYIPLSRATIADQASAEQLAATVEANRAVAASFVFLVPHAQWGDLTTGERALADSLVRKGSSFALSGVRSLRLDIAELASQGVRSLRIDAGRFIEAPEAFTDFHATDIASYVARSGVVLLGSGITGERQIVELIDAGITLAQGPHIAPPGPIRPDLASEAPRVAAAQQLRRVDA